ncbi:MAG: choice-of-anchor D domain-containing protein [Bacteroidota bacterium]
MRSVRRCGRLLMTVVFSIPAMTLATIHSVPSQYPTIRAAIEAAVDGDTVLVAPGTYAENINFAGKNIVVASRYIVSGDPLDIAATIIHGGSPVDPDTASCVLIVSGEDTTAVLEGFTLTGGSGTKWTDEHGAGVYREGGGILITFSSPTIRHNLIIDNEAINSTGSVSAGGGGIRVGDGAPRIVTNAIIGNRGMYGGGIVLNYCSGTIIRNNVISQNRVFQAVPGVQTFGGGGVWVYRGKPGDTTPNIIENNTILGNSAWGTTGTSPSAGRGGGMHVDRAVVIVRNTIVWNNLQTIGNQINGSPDVSYSDVGGGFAGSGNIDANPLFADSSFLLLTGSPCADAGDEAAAYNDPENPGSPGEASPPAVGTLRNDMGAYGGPGGTLLPPFSRPGIYVPGDSLDLGYVLPGGTGWGALTLFNLGSSQLEIDRTAFVLDGGASLGIQQSLPLQVRPGSTDTLVISWSPTESSILEDTLLLFHNDETAGSPWPIRLTGSSVPTALLEVDVSEIDFGALDVNTPSRDTVFTIRNSGTAEDSVYLSLDYRGLKPEAALSVTPVSVSIGPGDSLEVRFTFFPPLIVRTFNSLYTPRILIDSQFSGKEKHFERPVRIVLVGTLSAEDPVGTVPATYFLEQNYPNPFNPTTLIAFGLPRSGHITMKIFNVVGELVGVLADGFYPPGRYRAAWDAGHLPTGTYFYQLRAGERVLTKKLLLIR